MTQQTEVKAAALALSTIARLAYPRGIRARIRNRLKQATDERRFADLFQKYKSDTMIDADTFIANLRAASEVLPNLMQGAIVECGTWRGGMSAALMELGGPRRNYYFFDSFEGLPPAKEIDGRAAADYQSDTTSDFYHDNCRASIDEFRSTISRTGFALDNVHIIKGFYEETLPGRHSEPIAVLRLDADWYDSTMICLQTFWDHVVPGGLILIDDYYTWDGCSRAVHDFLSSRKATERITQKGPLLAAIQKRLASP